MVYGLYFRFPLDFSQLAMESTRKIGRHHLAFYRGWLQGLDLKVAADRYLESGLDQRIARSTLAWIQQT